MNPDENAIRALVAKWHRATTAGAVDAVLPLMAEDVAFLVTGQSPMRGKGMFEKGLRALLASHRIRSTGDVQEVAVSGDLAYCWSILNVELTPIAGGGTVRRSGSALSILRKQSGGAWVIIRDANLLAVVK